jgi:nickel-dependent lactate racemase
MKKARFILVTGLDRQLAKEMLFTGAVDTVEEALKRAEEYVGKDYNVILMPTGSLTVPLYEG